jgi:hypothetical protein
MQQTYNGMPNRLYHPRTKSPTDRGRTARTQPTPA